MYFTFCLSTEGFQLTDPSTITFIKYHLFQNTGKTSIFVEYTYIWDLINNTLALKTNHVGKEEFEVQ